MELNDLLVHELIQELRKINENLKEVKHELMQHQVQMREIHQYYREDKATFDSILSYLRDYQGIMDYQLSHDARTDKEAMLGLKKMIMSISDVWETDRVGASALNNAPISSDGTPIYTNAKPFLQYLAEVTNAGTNVTSRLYYRIGFLTNVSTTVQQFLDEGYSSEPAISNPNGLVLRVFSSSPNDTATGSGAQKIFISGIDASGMRANETIALAGTTRVNTATTWKYLDFFAIIAVGTYNGGASGNISLTNIGESITYALIPTARRSWRSGRIHVPVNGRGYIHQWVFGSFKNDVSFELLVSPDTDKNIVIGRSATNTTGQSTNILFPAPIYIPSNGRVIVQAIAAGTVNQADTSFSLHITT